MPAVDQRRSGQHRGQLRGHIGLGTQATGDPALAVSLLVVIFSALAISGLIFLPKWQI